MEIFYSPSTGGFYPAYMHSEYEAEGTLPGDLIEIPAGRREELAAGEAAGKRIIPDANGHPVLAEQAQEPQAVALERAIIDIKKQRTPILAALDGIAGRMFRAGDYATAQAADAAIVALLDITKLPALLAAASYDEMKDIVLARYRQIAGAAPALVQSAFLEVVAA